MLTKAELKYYSSLLNKKKREEENKFLVEGPKLIPMGISAGFTCEIIFYTVEFEIQNKKLLESLSSGKIRIEQVKNSELAKLTDTNTPQNIVAVFRKKEEILSDKENNILIALENINDPGNLGTIIRNCDWFGFQSIILSDGCAEIYNPKVIRSSAGSVFNVRIHDESNFYSKLNELKNSGYTILCADLNGENIYQRTWDKKIIVAFANEANGPSDELINISDAIITIPGRGKAESLNVANASAVILSEIFRQS